MFRPLLALYLRDLRQARRVGGGSSMGIVFFLILCSIVPFAIGPDLKLLARIGPAILWIAALLATLLGLERLFQTDQDDGSLDQLRLADTPLELVVLAKCAAHWTATGLPLVIAGPLFGILLAMEPRAMVMVMASLALGTPALTLIASVGAALTVGLRRGGMLLAILVLPFTIPILIFGVSAASFGQVMTSAMPFFILAAIALFSLATTPFAAAAALRISGE